MQKSTGSLRTQLPWWLLGLNGGLFLYYLLLTTALDNARHYPLLNAFADFFAVPSLLLLLALPVVALWMLWRMPEGKWRPALALLLDVATLALIARAILASGGC